MRHTPAKKNRVAQHLVLSLAAVSALVPLYAMVSAALTGGGETAAVRSRMVLGRPELVVRCEGSAKLTVKRGAHDALLLGACAFTAKNADINVHHLRAAFNGEHINMLVGTSSTRYFSNLQFKTPAGAALMGPIEIPAVPGSRAALRDVRGSFAVPSGATVFVNLTGDIADHEDRAGEFFGNTYGATLAMPVSADVCAAKAGGLCAPTGVAVAVQASGVFATLIFVQP